MHLYAGTNDFASYHAARGFADKLSTQQQTEIEVIDGDELKDVSQLMDNYAAVGMFSESKILFVKRAMKNKQVWQQLADTDLVTADTVVFWDPTAPDKRQKLIKQLKKKSRLHEFELPKEYKLWEWVLRIGKRYDLRINKSQAEVLIDLCNQNLWVVDQQLQKLAIYLRTTGSKLDPEVINTVIAGQSHGNIWDLIDAYADADHNNIVRNFRGLVTDESQVHYLIVMLNRELKQLMLARSHKLSGTKLAMHPYAAKQLLRRAAKFDDDRLRAAWHNLVNLDSDIKQGALDPEPGLLVYLLEN